jgi:hypothetical protein
LLFSSWVKVTDAKAVGEILDFTVNSKGRYLKEDHDKIEQRIINEAPTASHQ